MSKEKMERYKQEKANRKQNVKKARRKKLLSRIGAVLFSLAFVAFMGWSVYKEFGPTTEKEEPTTSTRDMYTAEEYESVKESVAAEGSIFETTSANNNAEDDQTGDNETTTTGEETMAAEEATTTIEKEEETTTIEEETTTIEEETTTMDEDNGDEE